MGLYKTQMPPSAKSISLLYFVCQVKLLALQLHQDLVLVWYTVTMPTHPIHHLKFHTYSKLLNMALVCASIWQFHEV